MNPQELAPQQVRETLRAVLEREGLPLGETTRTHPLEELFGWLVDDWGSTAVPAVRIVPYVLAFLALVGLVAMIVPLLGGRGGAEAGLATGPGALRRRERTTELVARARAARAAGDRLLAARTYLLALVVGLGERGDLEFQPAWTNRELLDRGEPRPEVRARLVGLFDALDPKTFGHAPLEEADLQTLDELCGRLLAEGSL